MTFTLIILSFCISYCIFPIMLRIAIKYRIVDNPNVRKLQKKPVPAFGGGVVLCAIIIPTLIAIKYYQIANVWYMLGAILFLCVMGVTDDIKGLNASLRFILEVFLVWMLILHPLCADNGPMIDSLHGLLGRESLSLYTAVPLTLISAVGLINSINLIDGVDGYSSGYGIVCNMLFATIFYILGDKGMAIMNVIIAAALIPFYLHNVFGKKSKMFLGDGGSLVVGFLVANNVLTLLSSQTNTMRWESQGEGLVALALAVTSIPVFDTIRVMIARIIDGRSPFSPDKGHLHHAFIALGFAHFATSSLIILMNVLIVVLWYVSFLMGASVTLQFVIVVVLGICATSGVYYTFRYTEKHHNGLWRFLTRIGRWSHFEEGIVWKKIEQIVDIHS